MKKRNGFIKTFIIVILGIVLYSIPIICIYLITNRELSEYEITDNYDFKEKAYGSLVSPTRQNIKENFIVNGEVISSTYRIVKLPECDISNVNLNVQEGDEVSTGEKIGTDGNVTLYSSATGIVESINLEQLTIKVKTFDKLILRIKVDKNIITQLNDKLVDEDGNEYEVIEKSNQYVDGTMSVDLRIKTDKYKYGEKVNGLCLYTGKEYEDVLVIKKDCVYNKPGSKDYFVRLCDDNGNYLSEKKVTVSFEYDEYMCVTGLTEQDQCDSGYKYVINNEEVPQDSIVYQDGDDVTSLDME